MSLQKLRMAFRRIMPSGNTTERTTKSIVWAIGQNAFGRILQFGMLVILARLVGPREIGLLGISLLALSAIRRFTNIGLDSAIIQREEDNVDPYLDTKWCLEIGRGVLITAILLILSPFIASLFNEPRTTDLIRAIAFSPLIIGLRNPGIVYFQKELEYHKIFIYRVGGEITQFCVAVGYALIWPSVWAFVAGLISGNIVRLISSYIIHDYRPHLTFDPEIAKEIVDYGKWIVGSSILYFLHGEGDDAFVGWLLAPAALGFYQYSYRFSNAPATEISELISGVMFATFSDLQKNTAQLRNTFLRTVRLTSFIVFPMAFGIITIAPSFVHTFLGSEWTPMIIPMQILAVYGLLRAISKIFHSIWKAMDEPDYITKISLLRVILIGIIIYPLTRQFGITGTAIAVTGVYLLPVMPLNVYLVSQSIQVSHRQIYNELLYPFIASLIMVTGTWYLQHLIDVHPTIEFVLTSVTGVIIYILSIVVIEIQFEWGIRNNIRSIISNF